MAAHSPYLRILKAAPAFAALSEDDLHLAYSCSTLRVLPKGERWCIAGGPVPELGVVVSGRLVEENGAAPASEFAQGDAVEGEAFFLRRQASATVAALRETVLLAFSWDDLSTHPQLLTRSFASFVRDGAGEGPNGRKPAIRPLRLAICPSSGRSLPPSVMAALLPAFESYAETRVLSRGSFGGALPGALALSAPETAHWLQQQELEFDLTIVMADLDDEDFARQAIEEADEVLFAGGIAAHGSSTLHRHALAARGPQHCRLFVVKGSEEPGSPNRDARVPSGAFRTAQGIDFEKPTAVGVACANLLGHGVSIAASSSGVYAAAILGALQAFEARGLPAVSLAASGSAILPAGLLAVGASLAQAESIFRELANPHLWKRSVRGETGLYDHTALDALLLGALGELDIGMAERPFSAVSLSASSGGPLIHRSGLLRLPVRAGLLPPGLLAPLILSDGTILLSGQDLAADVLSALSQLTDSPAILLQAEQAPFGPSSSPYQALGGGGLFRLASFQSQGAPDPRVRLEAVLSASWPKPPAGLGPNYSMAIPIPSGIMPLDWEHWQSLRDRAFEWAFSKLDAAEFPTRAPHRR
jgi:NTE family protein